MKIFDGDDVIGDDEFDDMMEISRQDLKRHVMKKIQENKDNQVKEIGDYVLLWDHSRLTYEDTNEFVTDELDINLMLLYPSIVVETRVDYDAKISWADRSYNVQLDLVVWNKTINRKFRTSSKFVKLIQPFT